MARRTRSIGLATRAFVLLSAIACASGQPARAQDTSMSPDDRRLSEIFSGLGEDRAVRITTPSFFVEDAFVTSVGPDYVELAQAGTNVNVGFDDIRGVSVEKSHWLQGALWGAGAGIVIGGVAGLMVASFSCTTPETCNDLERRGMIRWATVFGIGGALGGFAIGRNSIYWSSVFP
jgi:hypothetical protein